MLISGLRAGVTIFNLAMEIPKLKTGRSWRLAKRESATLLDQLLINRGISLAGKGRFLEPDFDRDFRDPFEIKGLLEATRLIKTAVEAREKIGIFADYDADGITAGALFWRALNRLSGRTNVYLPSRRAGYGLSKEGILALKNQGALLIVAFDLGQTAKAEVAYAKKLGLEVIIVDHHHILESQLPKGAIIINPKQASCPSPFKDFSAGGLAYKLVTGLAKDFPHQLTGAWLKWEIDLPAISTIADLVPLLDENRLIARFGLKVLNQTRNIGLQALKIKAGLTDKIKASKVGFVIAPRINAAGRIDDPKKSFELLISTERSQAMAIASILEELNLKRQRKVEEALLEAVVEVEGSASPVLVVGRPDWLPGVWGLVAAKLVEQFNRPALVYGLSGGLARGSARSVEGFHLVEAFSANRELFEGFGGHARAAGFQFNPKAVETVREKLGLLAEKLSPRGFKSELKIDSELSLGKIDRQLVKELSLLEPHGLGNPEPKFLSKAVQLFEPQLVGGTGKHLRAKIFAGETIFSVIAFNQGRSLIDLVKNGPIDMVFSLSINRFRGKESIEVKIVEARSAGSSSFSD